jgi:23S rRNA pseudouridine1911/1915/1917 synthase
VSERTIPVPDGLDGMRVDAGLARLLGLSRTAVAGLAEEGQVRIDGHPLNKSDRLIAGSWLEISLPEPERVPTAPTAAEVVDGLNRLHEDDDIVIVEKPVGVAAHPSPGWEGPTVTAGLAALGVRLSTSGAAERQGIVHRLDAGTTGIMVVAKSEHAYTALKRAFKQREVTKRYHAIVQGHPDPSRGTVDAPIDRHPRHDWRFAVVNGGRPSVTHYDTVEAFPAASLLEIILETGRTHQIRVHMSALRHPCVGDASYGADPTLAARLGLARQWLHARQLGFAHPADGRYVEFTSDYPDDLWHALEMLRADG